MCFAGFFVDAQPTVAHSSGGFIPNSAELKAERRKPSGERPCDIQDAPSLTGVLGHFRLHQLNAIGLYAGGAKTLQLPTRPEGPFLFLPPSRASPLGLRRLHAGGASALGLRRLYAGGAKTLQLPILPEGPFVFLPPSGRKKDKEKKPAAALVAASSASAGASPTGGLSNKRASLLPSIAFRPPGHLLLASIAFRPPGHHPSWPPSALCRRGQDSSATYPPPKPPILFRPPFGADGREWGAVRITHAFITSPC